MSEIILKTMQESDLKLVLKWRNSERIRNCMYNNQIITWSEHINWFDSCKKKGLLNFVYWLDDYPVGVLNITDIDYKNKTCSWSIYRGIETPKKGIGLKMGNLAVEYIFNKMNFRKIYVEVLSNNVVSFNFHQKLGMSLEGTFKEQIIRNGDLLDVYRLALFNGLV